MPAVLTVLTVTGTLLVFAGALLPWVLSGTVERNSYATVRAAQLVGVVGNRPWELALSLWFATPILAALVLVGLILRRRVIVVVSAVALASFSIVLSVVVLLAPVAHGAGPIVAMIGALVLATAIVLGRR